MRYLIGSLLGVGLAVALVCPQAQAQLVPVGGGHGGAQWAPVAPGCPTPYPGTVPSPYPGTPGGTPGTPGGTPGTPGGTPGTPGGTPGMPGGGDPFATGAQPGAGTGGFDASQARGTEAGSTASENLLGDLAGGGYFQTIVVVPSGVSGSAHFVTRLVRVPAVGRGSFKITEGESPRPQDRVFLNYNYYDKIGTFDSGATVRPNLDRETFGFEKTCLDGNASIGLRVPVFELNRSDGNLKREDIGDLTIIGKYAFVNDCHGGNVISGGLAVTVPTGPDEILADGTRLHSTLLQPFIGYICGGGGFYLEGFSAVVVPTDSRDTILLTNDFGLGYTLFRDTNCDGWITAITPTVEGHITTPLNHRGLSSGETGFPDIFVLTAGAHIGIGKCAVLTAGGAIPLTGPKPFDWEGIVQFNILF
jgi:hypothetical protein